MTLARGTKLRSASHCALLVIWMVFGTATEASADWPPWLERWLFNPSERTARGIELIERDEAPAAVAPLTSALRMTEGRPAAQYNAGTAHLEAQTGDALTLLESAAQKASDDLRADAHYNLGNARLARNDLTGAIEAYRQTLRINPESEDAKFNLELALHRLRQDPPQQQEQQPQDDPQENQNQEGQPDSEEGDQTDSNQNRQQSGEGDSEQPQNQPQGEAGEDNSGNDPQESEPPRPGDEPTNEQGPEDHQSPRSESPLPQFRDLPDMTAEEAAAILEAIDNLEREQRRQRALEAARRTSRGGKDW